ncbi:phage head completion protein [Sphingomonas sp. LHG3443-2]|uniref:phage head completion protein n=1 Tax=Sphingomonas sp. LHG3443-2 TaxID=2804639 RepID=UPI003CE722A6
MSEFAGSLTQRIELWERSQARLMTGASSEEMNLVLSCRASIVAEGSGAPDEAMSVSAMPRYRITVRKLADFTIDQQVRWRGRRLMVRQIVDDPMLPDRLVLRCEEQR